MLPRREYSAPASLSPWRTCISVNEFVSYSGYNAIKFSSPGKESACKVGDPSLIPGLWRSHGEGIGYWLQYSWASQVAQLVKNLPIMRETWVQSLGWEDPLEKGTTTHSSILAWRITWTEESGRLQSMELQRVGHNWVTFTFTFKVTLVVQLVKNLPTLQEIHVQPLDWEYPLEKAMATHSSILAWKNPMDGGAWQPIVYGVTSVGHDLATKPPP